MVEANSDGGLEVDEAAADSEQYRGEGYPTFTDCERGILLQILDTQWKDHLHTMDGLREGISMRAYGQRDPKLEYQREGYALFQEMNDRIDTQALELVFKFALPPPPDELARAQAPGLTGPPASGPLANPKASLARGRAASGKPQKAGKVGRNHPCPCGSGKKYKKCHGVA